MSVTDTHTHTWHPALSQTKRLSKTLGCLHQLVTHTQSLRRDVTFFIPTKDKLLSFALCFIALMQKLKGNKQIDIHTAFYNYLQLYPNEHNLQSNGLTCVISDEWWRLTHRRKVRTTFPPMPVLFQPFKSYASLNSGWHPWTGNWLIMGMCLRASRGGDPRSNVIVCSSE